jgi:hypothetical protein
MVECPPHDRIAALGGLPVPVLGLLELPPLFEQRPEVIGGVGVACVGRLPVPGLGLMHLHRPPLLEQQPEQVGGVAVAGVVGRAEGSLGDGSLARQVGSHAHMEGVLGMWVDQQLLPHYVRDWRGVRGGLNLVQQVVEDYVSAPVPGQQSARRVIPRGGKT